MVEGVDIHHLAAVKVCMTKSNNLKKGTLGNKKDF